MASHMLLQIYSFRGQESQKERQACLVASFSTGLGFARVPTSPLGFAIADPVRFFSALLGLQALWPLGGRKLKAAKPRAYMSPAPGRASIKSSQICLLKSFVSQAFLFKDTQGHFNQTPGLSHCGWWHCWGAATGTGSWTSFLTPQPAFLTLTETRATVCAQGLQLVCLPYNSPLASRENRPVPRGPRLRRTRAVPG